MSVVNIVVSVLFDIAELARVSAVAPVTSPVWVAFDTIGVPLIWNPLAPAVMKLTPADEILSFSVFAAPISTELATELFRFEPKADELDPEAVLLYPTAVLKFPAVKLQIPTAVVSRPIVPIALAVPVIAPVVVFKVAPVELFKVPIPTDANPPAPVKFLLPNSEAFRAAAVL
jgi:hypothetical protein